MNNLILCEGATDAILLSYYLGHMYGWKYCKPPKEIDIKESINETVNWYKRDEDRLLICSVGGKDNFKNFYLEKIEAPILLSNGFDRFIVISDRDNNTVSSIENKMSQSFSSAITHIENKKWTDCLYKDSYGIEKNIESMLIVIPSEHEGALETVMLQAISENPYDNIIVEKVKEFVHDMRNCALKYIASDRLELKADLGVTWAIQYPEKVFRLIDEQIKSVKWEKSEVLKECFGILELL